MQLKETNMNITIDSFKKDLIKALGVGGYEVSVQKNDKSKILYMGESVFVLVRCASHLYELNKNPKYFGFTEEIIKDSSITLKFRLLEKIYKKDLRKKEKLSS